VPPLLFADGNQASDASRLVIGPGDVGGRGDDTDIALDRLVGVCASHAEVRKEVRSYFPPTMRQQQRVQTLFNARAPSSHTVALQSGADQSP